MANREPTGLLFHAQRIRSARIEARLRLSSDGSHGANSDVPIFTRFEIKVGTQVVTAVIKVGNIAFLVHKTATDIIVAVAASTRNGNIMLDELARSKHLVDVVHVVPAIVGVVVEHFFNIALLKSGHIILTTANGSVG